MVHSSFVGIVWRLYLPAASFCPLIKTSSVTSNCVASLAPLNARPMIGNGHVRDSDGLHHSRLLAGTWKAHRCSLRRSVVSCARAKQYKCKTKTVEGFQGNHGMSLLN